MTKKLQMRPLLSSPACLTLALLGWNCLAMRASQAQTIFNDVTLATLGDVRHEGTPIMGEVQIGTGAVWFDYDRDGDLDLYMTNRVGPNHLWRNDGGGVFVDVATELGADDASHDSAGAVAADFDNDGDLDLYLANGDDDVLLKNQLTETGSASFIDVTATAFPGITTPQRGTSASWGDYDKDGFLDLYVANHAEIERSGTGTQDRLFHNNSGQTFTDVSYFLLAGDANHDGHDDNLGGHGFIAGWTDYDNDGDLDIFLINDCPHGPVGTKLFRNDGGSDPLAWTFTEVSDSVGAADCRAGMGIAVGDYDRDGWLDYFYTNITSPLLLHNDGGTFSDVTGAAGLVQEHVPETGKKRVTWGAIFFDYDLDGFLDLCVAAGTLKAGDKASTFDPQPNLLYHNDGNGISFTNVSTGSGFEDSGRGRTVVMGDYDGDGDPDLFVVNYAEKVFLLRNDYANTTGNHWLILDLQGAGPPLSNRDGVGAKIKLTTPDGVVQRWETRSGDSLGGGSDLAAYFGLGSNALVSEIEVTWLSGTVQTLTDIAADQRMAIVEPASTAPIITVTSPNGKETWIKGTTYTITWTDNISGDVRIRLINGDRKTIAVIAAATPSSGSFDWTIPTSLAAAKYKVKIDSLEDRTVQDQSDARFTIEE